MNEADIPIDIHTLKLQDWLVSRRIVGKSIQAPLKDIRSKISNALQDMPSNEALIALLSGTNINYYHCREIVEILKQTERDSKGLFGSYSSQRMKDWQEILRLYERENVYLAEAAQIYVRNTTFEIPGLKRQMAKLEQQSEEASIRAQLLSKPEAQLLAERATLLQQLGVPGEDLREEFISAIEKLPELYAQSIANIGGAQEAIELYAEYSGNKCCLSILRHLIQCGNTTVYQYIHKEAPLAVEEPPSKLRISAEDEAPPADAGIDFGVDDNGGTSSTTSAEVIDFGDFTLEGESGGGGGADIDWGIETTGEHGEESNVEINFDIPVEEYGIVVESAGLDGGTARGDQAYTILDSPSYRDRYLDELHELEAFLRLRLAELTQMENAGHTIFSPLDTVGGAHDVTSIRPLLQVVEQLVRESGGEQLRHLCQLKHSPKYADLVVGSLRQMANAVDKIRATRETLKARSAALLQQRKDLTPALEAVIEQTRQLQTRLEEDVSRRYKHRPVNLLGGP